MVARVPVEDDRPNALLRAVMASMLVATPMMAVSKGSPAAAMDPKVTRRTSAATSTPAASPTPPASVCAPMALPPVSTVRPASFASLSTCWSSSLLPSEMSLAVTL